MSGWTQNDLQQSGQNNSNQAPVDVATMEPPPEVRIFIEETARRFLRLGLVSVIDESDVRDLGEKFKFLSKSDPFHAFYQRKLTDIGAEKKGEPFDGSEPRNPSFILPGDISRTEIGVIKLTVQFCARYGIYFREELTERVGSHPLFDFMKNPRHRWMHYVSGLINAYCKVLTSSKRRSNVSVVECFFDRLQLDKLDKGDETALINLHALVNGVDSFAHMVDVDYSEFKPPPAHLSSMLQPCMLVQPQLGSQLTECRMPQNQDGAQPDPSAGIPLKELGIIKLTAQFVARFGKGFRRDLIEKMAVSPLFDFMNQTSSRIDLFNGLVAVYSRILRNRKSLSDSDALTCFLQRLQLEKLELEEGEEMAAAVIDMHAFVSGVDLFAFMENDDYSAFMPQPAHLSTTMNLPTQIQGSKSQAPPLPMPE